MSSFQRHTIGLIAIGTFAAAIIITLLHTKIISDGKENNELSQKVADKERVQTAANSYETADTSAEAAHESAAHDSGAHDSAAHNSVTHDSVAHDSAAFGKVKDAHSSMSSQRSTDGIPSATNYDVNEFSREPNTNEIEFEAQSDAREVPQPEEGDVGAVVRLFELGCAYDSGDGVEQNDELAMKWYLAAAEKGHAESMYCVGFLFLNGQGVEQSDEEAARWYRKSAEKGFAKAQSSLAFMYSTGQGVERSSAKAVKWFRKAADENQYPEAQCMLGSLYAHGDGVPQDIDEAKRWYRKAADQGDTIARAAYRELLLG